MASQIDASTLNALLGTAEEPLVLDVRNPEEADWQIPGALLVPMTELNVRWSELPKGKPIVTVCASGRRSELAATFLEEKGFDVSSLTGGMRAWASSYDYVPINLVNSTVIQIRRRGKGCLSYIVMAIDEAYVVDPSSDINLYLDLARSNGVKITKVFDTHLHADHVSGARQLAKVTGADLYLNPLDHFEFDYLTLSDGESFSLGGIVKFAVTVLHSPGHTEGSTNFIIENKAVLTGDTLFVESVGRPDLAERAEEFANHLFDSLHNKLLRLDDTTLILPAHYAVNIPVKPGEPVATTVGNVKNNLEALNLSKEEFVKWCILNVSERPPNYDEIIRINMGKHIVDPNQLMDLEAGPNRCSVGH